MDVFCTKKSNIALQGSCNLKVEFQISRHEEESSFSEGGSSTKIYQQLCTKKKLAKKAEQL